MPAKLTPIQARRIALAAQGFADRPPAGAVTLRHVQRVVGRTKLIQMDSVNVAVRAHYLPLFSRLGPYDRNLLDKAAWNQGRRARLLTEYWAHEAALIPVADWPLFGWRMDEFRDGRYQFTREMMQRNRSLAADVRDVIAESGASTPRSIEAALGIKPTPRESGGWWHRGEIKHLCEAMFASGELAAVRDGAFGRYYDLAERVVGADVVDRRVARGEAIAELVARASAALGIATIADLADYYRLKTKDVRPVVAQMVATGMATQVSVAGWKDDAYLAAGVAVPAATRRRRTSDEVRGTLLSPFDPLVFYRPRGERIFDFHYRIEIYVPEHKRVHGYYVHPYLLGDELVARVDVKADRGRGVLLVPGAFAEEGQDVSVVARALAADLSTFADWLGLKQIEIGSRGDLAEPLRRLIN